eukprot:GFUD01124802.1.p1 GENE.GFUD01124802.1~~GFUD01124802.1.p1  ORF type:complete len:284 (+),score=84.44 GFUD01124802.1:55-852(+)
MDKHKSSLCGKVVLITGASSGIGAGTSQHLASLGCRLSLVARNRSALESVKKECIAGGAPEVLILSQDVGVEEECQLVVEKTAQHFGGIDVLVNNAGVLIRSDFASVTMEEVDLSMQINLKSAIKLSQACLPHLQSVQGCIVNVSSIAGLRAYPGALAYKMSKAALDQMTRCVALEVASSGVRVNSVNPGVIITEIFTNSGMTEEESKTYLENSKKTHPLGRPGTVLEVAKAITFLGSEDASFITGQTLAVDGGRSVTLPAADYN